MSGNNRTGGYKAIMAALLLLLLSQTGGLAQGKVTLQPAQLVAGRQVQLVYDPAGTALAGKASVTAIAYIFSDYHWIAKDIVLTKKGQQWAGSYQAGDKDAVLALKFVADTLHDMNGEKGYIYSLTKADGKAMPGAAYGQALIQCKALARINVPQYPDTKSLGAAEMGQAIEKELQQYPQAVMQVFYARMELLRNEKPFLEAREQIHAAIRQLLEDGWCKEENDFLTVGRVTEGILHDNAYTDSIRDIGINRFPGGILAQQKTLNTIVNSGLDKEEKAARWHELGKVFDWSRLEEIAGGHRIDFSGYFEWMLDSNYDRLMKVLPALSFDQLNAAYYRLVVLAYLNKHQTAEFLLPYARTMIHALDSSAKVISNCKLCSPVEWNAAKADIMAEWYSVHAEILNKNGLAKEAWPYAQKAFEAMPCQRPVVNELYLQMLPDGPVDKLAIMEKCFRLNTATPWMFEQMEKYYVAKHGNSKGFSAYLQGMKSPQWMDYIKGYVEKRLINVKLSDFALKDPAGNLIQSKDLLGKVVVLDFWATWCLPCKASFEGMKLAVAQYKEDSDVQFLFASTAEYTPDYKKTITSFLKEKGYDFHVLYDEKKDKATKSVYDRYMDEFAGAGYAKSGIPLKLFFDKAGVCRFMEVGYLGKPMVLADEVSVIVDTLKDTKKPG